MINSEQQRAFETVRRLHDCYEVLKAANVAMAQVIEQLQRIETDTMNLLPRPRPKEARKR
jgi:hypothetical protein